MEVNRKTRHRVSADSTPTTGELFRHARTHLGLTQGELAKALGSSQGAITRWERDIDFPSPKAMVGLAKLLPESQRELWYTMAGVQDGIKTAREMAPDLWHLLAVPLLKDSAAAGTPRAVDEREIDQVLMLPKNYLSSRESLVAVSITGDSMAPVLLDGHIVVVDTSKKKADELVRHMVAARDSEGAVTVKWLRKNKAIYSLVPQHVSPEYDLEYLKPTGDFELVGEVVMWIGTPPKARRQ